MDGTTIDIFNWLSTTLGGILVVAGFITAVSVAVSWLTKLFKRIAKPHTDLDALVHKLADEHPMFDSYMKENRGEIIQLKQDQQVLFSCFLDTLRGAHSEEIDRLIVKELEGYLVQKSLDHSKLDK